MSKLSSQNSEDARNAIEDFDGFACELFELFWRSEVLLELEQDCRQSSSSVRKREKQARGQLACLQDDHSEIAVDVEQDRE